jgi:hypothetical protein
MGKERNVRGRREGNKSMKGIKGRVEGAEERR